MSNENNIVFEIRFDSKSAKILEDHTKILSRFTDELKKNGFKSGGKGGSSKDLEQELKIENERTKNVRAELELEYDKKEENRKRYEIARLELNILKTKDLALAREKSFKGRLMVEEKRHWNSIMERMMSGTLGVKMMGMSAMGAKGGISGVGKIGSGLKNLMNRTSTGQAFNLQAGLSKEEDLTKGYSGGSKSPFANMGGRMGGVKAGDVEAKKAAIANNKVLNSLTQTIAKTKSVAGKLKPSGATAKIMGGVGIGGMGIAGAVITKAIESSPIAQAMMKIMSTAFTLILRPIGDFIGGMIKPIAMKVLTLAMANLKNFPNLSAMGEKVGNVILALFTDPAAVMNLLVTRMVSGLSLEIRSILPEWLGGITLTIEEKAAEYAKIAADFDAEITNITGVITGVEALISVASTQVSSDIQTVYEAIGVLPSAIIAASKANADAIVAEQEKVAKRAADALALEKAKHARDMMKEMEKTGEREHIGVKTQEVLIAEKYAKMNLEKGEAKFVGQEGYKEKVFNRTSMFSGSWAETEGGTKFDETNNMAKYYHDEMGKLNNKELSEKGKLYQESFAKTQISLEEKYNMMVQETQTQMDLLQQGTVDVETVKEGQKENLEKITEVITDEVDVRTTTAQILKEGSAVIADLNTKNIVAAWLQHTQVKTISVLKVQEVSLEKGIFKLLSDLAKAASEMYVAAMAAMAAARAAARRSSSASSSRGRGRAVGGMITEPVQGVGLWTGNIWSFGENGNEWVTPMRGGKGQANNNYDQKSTVLINVNVDKMSSDIDLQKLKPIVERAIRETHSRRGII